MRSSSLGLGSAMSLDGETVRRSPPCSAPIRISCSGRTQLCSQPRFLGPVLRPPPLVRFPDPLPPGGAQSAFRCRSRSFRRLAPLGRPALPLGLGHPRSRLGAHAPSFATDRSGCRRFVRPRRTPPALHSICADPEHRAHIGNVSVYRSFLRLQAGQRSLQYIST